MLLVVLLRWIPNRSYYALALLGCGLPVMFILTDRMLPAERYDAETLRAALVLSAALLVSVCDWIWRAAPLDTPFLHQFGRQMMVGVSTAVIAWWALKIAKK